MANDMLSERMESEVAQITGPSGRALWVGLVALGMELLSRASEKTSLT
jgi:hypothetical protein